MNITRLALLASVASAAATPLLAQESREMEAHVHGVSTVEIAVEGHDVEIDLLSPGMDIVGFEYEASSDTDKDAVEAAIRVLLMPENVLTLPDAAECRLTEVLAHLHSGDHGHGEGEGHEDHAEGEDHDHVDHDDHAEGEDHDHDHDDHEDHAEGEDHGHEEGAQHSEFHASYSFACEHPEELTAIAFPFFERFGNGQEIEAQYVTEAGAGSAEIGRDAPDLSLN